LNERGGESPGGEDKTLLHLDRWEEIFPILQEGGPQKKDILVEKKRSGANQGDFPAFGRFLAGGPKKKPFESIRKGRGKETT